ncbi:cyclic phosphodiesterase-like [Rosa rugosa]|uniref:cyclic phosphodiesterase-like n=1 Tax=Rosa rugosa TaxID=74645 RepID=UPI002B418099|nr:cyclic phosphodiesterase-like [Rosa rugosa]
MPISPEQEALEAQKDAQEVHRYAVWGLLPENANTRIKKVMEALREEFGGPEIEPHITIVGSCLMTEDEAIGSFREGCNSVKQIYCKVENFETSKFYFQCLSLVMEITEDLKAQTRWFAGCMNRPFPAMPHLSLLYGNLTAEEKKRAKEKVLAMDESIAGLTFLLSRMALYRVNFADRTQKSWERILEGHLRVN